MSPRRGLLRTKAKDMNININGKGATTDATTMQELADQLRLPEAGVAVAVGGKMAPRTRWAETPLRENESVVIIKVACGG